MIPSYTQHERVRNLLTTCGTEMTYFGCWGWPSVFLSSDIVTSILFLQESVETLLRQSPTAAWSRLESVRPVVLFIHFQTTRKFFSVSNQQGESLDGFLPFIFLTGTESEIVTLGQSLGHAVPVEFKSYMTHNTRLAVTQNRGGWEDNPLNTSDEGESVLQ